MPTLPTPDLHLSPIELILGMLVVAVVLSYLARRLRIAEPILFAAAFFTPIRDFRANTRPILLLAVGLVLFTTAVVGIVATAAIPGLSLAAAVTLGAASFSIVGSSIGFLYVAVGGIVVGAAIGLLITATIRKTSDPLLE